MSGTINKLMSVVKEFAASNIGYDQNSRDSWHDAKYTKIIKNKEADCSSATLGIVKMAGYDINLSGQHNTSNAADLLKNAGWKITNYTGKSQCKKGRVFITPGHHMNIATGTNQMYNVGIDENGNATGGKAGDQNGKESRYEAFFNYPWKYVAIPPDEGNSKPAAKPASKAASKPAKAGTAPNFPLPKGWWYGPASGGDKSVSGCVKRGDSYTVSDGHGGYYAPGLKTWQARMKARGWTIGVDGQYGPETQKVCRQFQTEKKLSVDGGIGIQTWDAAWTAPITP